MDPERAQLTVQGKLAHLRLSRPDARNAIDPAMVQGFKACVEAVEKDPGVRAVLLSAEGDMFTVGGDLAHFAQNTDRLGDALDDMVPDFHDALHRLATMPVPVVAAVQGAIAGGGIGIAWCADAVIAASDARFATGFARIGLSGDGGNSWYLPRLVGLRRAQELMMFGRTLDAQEALQWGLISKVVEPDALLPEAEGLAQLFADGPTVALGHMRRLLRSSHDTPLREQLDAEIAAMRECGDSADGKEGILSFVERRPPNFWGR